MMRLKTEIIERIKGRKDLKRKLTDTLQFTRMNIWYHLDKNRSNGPLTTVAASSIISEMLGVPVADLFEVEQPEPQPQES